MLAIREREEVFLISNPEIAGAGRPALHDPSRRGVMSNYQQRAVTLGRMTPHSPDGRD
jgi:hypothetical protein